MGKKGKIIFALGLIFSIFLLFCTVINFARGHIGAAIGGLGSGIFFFSLTLEIYKKGPETQRNDKNREEGL
ncbi:MAG: hypothetical protein NC432_10690 [Roseburia sp.]|nr:hypothetical protein [Roseburia sp.]MCM1099250.1 hypothetical protein [Ruminococcus flavefaciens]